MIGFYIKPTGLERELDGELFWRPEVNMMNLSNTPQFFLPLARSLGSLGGSFARVMWGVKLLLEFYHWITEPDTVIIRIIIWFF